ncbi:MAG: hypothetical protein V3574_02015 [Candidatus Moraniibacteriota bacterium]
MKKITLLTLIISLLTIFPSLAMAYPENFGGNGDAWNNDFGNHYVNTKNPHVRKDWTNHLFAVPGKSGDHANEGSAVVDHPNGIDTLIDPNNICGTTSICR